MRRIVVTGSREWTDRSLIRMQLARAKAAGPFILVHGDARGADLIAAEIADGWGFKVDPHPAKWAEEGPGAPFARNTRMVRLPNVEVVLAFQLGQTGGTQHCVDQAKKQGIPVKHMRVPKHGDGFDYTRFTIEPWEPPSCLPL